MKKFFLIIGFAFLYYMNYAQNLEKMQWFNEPEKWHVNEGSLNMYVTPKTDFWRISHYGFTVDDGPFYYGLYGGEFEAKVKLSANYKNRFDQTGLMVRIDESHWIKAGVEFVDGKLNVSAVVTNIKSDWSVISLDKIPSFIWVKAVRRLDAIELFYSFDDKNYIMYRNAPFQDNCPAQVGMMGASPDGDGFDAKFENFSVKHLPDQRRLNWLEQHKS